MPAFFLARNVLKNIENLTMNLTVEYDLLLSYKFMVSLLSYFDVVCFHQQRISQPKEYYIIAQMLFKK